MYSYDPDVEEAVAANVNVKQLHIAFRQDFEMSEFCSGLRKGATYNIHAFSHMSEQRQVHWHAFAFQLPFSNLIYSLQGPNWQNSTELQENAYGSMQMCYQSGTQNITSQLICNYFLKDIHYHKCHPMVAMHAAEEGQELRKQEDNTIVVFKENLKPIFGRVLQKNDDLLKIREIVTEDFKSSLKLPPLPWELIGVKKICLWGDNIFTINKSVVTGKGVIVKDIISECQSQWLQSKRCL